MYYLKVMKVMILDQQAEDLEGRAPAPLREPAGDVLYAGLLTAAVVVLGLLWGPIYGASQRGSQRYLAERGVKPAEAPPAGPRPPARRGLRRAQRGAPAGEEGER